MRFGSTAEVLAKCNLEYYRISDGGEQAGNLGPASHKLLAKGMQVRGESRQHMVVQSSSS